jgi:hypothetical protein
MKTGINSTDKMTVKNIKKERIRRGGGEIAWTVEKL